MPYIDTSPRGSGIYAVVNTSTGCLYIGKTIYRFLERWTTHRRALRKGKHHCALLQEAWDQFGEGVFEFRILEAMPTGSTELDYLIAEQRHMQQYRGMLYNTR